MRIALASGKVLVAAVAAGLALAGCTSPGNGNGNGNGQHGPGMMGGGSEYHYSSPTCAAPANLPGQTVTVQLADMGMTQMKGGTAPLGARMMLRADPATVPAGTISLVATNRGWRTHELVVLPLAAGTAAGQRVAGADGTVDESGSLGEASASCGTGSGDGVAAGAVGWATLTLAPGRYELVCNLPNHYADGMYQEFTVTAS